MGSNYSKTEEIRNLLDYVYKTKEIKDELLKE